MDEILTSESVKFTVGLGSLVVMHCSNGVILFLIIGSGSTVKVISFEVSSQLFPVLCKKTL